MLENRITKVVNYFKSFFRKKIILLGRSGMLYKENNIKYHIDSEFLSGKEYDIVIYAKRIKVVNSDTPLSDKEKNGIAEKVRDELMSEGLRIDVEYEW